MKHPLGLPWIASLMIAAVLFGAAWLMFADALDAERERAMARVGGVPAAVSLDGFEPASGIGPADEVHVVGRIEAGAAGGGQRYVAMFGSNDDLETPVARAAIALGEGPADSATEDLRAQIEEFAASGGDFAMNGRADVSAEAVAAAAAALAERGLTMAPGFVVIEPWPGSREAAIASRAGLALMPAIGFAVAGLLAILLAILDLRAQARRKAILAGMPSWERAKLEAHEAEEARINRNRTILRRAILAIGGFGFLAVLALKPDWAGPALFAGMVPLIVYVVLLMSGRRANPGVEVEAVTAAAQPEREGDPEASILARHSSARLRPRPAALVPVADAAGPETAAVDEPADGAPEEEPTETPAETPAETGEIAASATPESEGGPVAAPPETSPETPPEIPPEKPPSRPLTSLGDLKREDAAPGPARPKDRPPVSLGSALSQRRAQLKRPAAPPPPRPKEPDDG